MTRQKAVAGYTIIEVMLFLLISSALLTSAMAIISGQQQKTQFTTGVREFESRLQDLINDVETGFFPTGNDIRCTVPGMESNPDAAPSLELVATGQEQGTSQDCVYLGKAVQFYKGADGTADRYRFLTIAGKRLDISPVTGKPAEPASLEESKPTAFRYDDSFTGVEDGKIPFGVEVTRIRHVTGFTPLATNDNYEQFAVVPSIVLREVNNTTSNLGGGRASLAALDGDPNLNESLSLLESAILTLSNSRVEDAGRGTIICLRDGAGGRPAAVTLGVQLVASAGGEFEAQPTGQQLTPQAFFDEQAEDLGCAS